MSAHLASEMPILSKRTNMVIVGTHLKLAELKDTASETSYGLCFAAHSNGPLCSEVSQPQPVPLLTAMHQVWLMLACT